MVYPHWVYAAVNLSAKTEEDIKNYCKEHLQWIVMNDDLHSTVAFSKKPKEWKIKRANFRWEWKFKRLSKFWEDKQSIVIELDSSDLVEHNKRLTEEHELVSDYDEYKPHITITYEWWDVDVDSLPPLDIIYELEHDYIEDLDDDDDDVMDAQWMVWFVM